MKLIHCILSIALAGVLCSSLLPATADAACAGGTCTPSGGGTSRGAPAGGGGSPGGGGGGHGGGGNYWGGVAAGAAAGVITGIITQQMMQQRQEPTYEEPARSRRVQRRSGSGNGDSSSDDVGVGDKAAVIETSPIDPPLNQYAQVPSDVSDTGIASDAGTGSTQPSTTGSAGPTQETTGSVGSSGSTTGPHVPGIPYEEPRDYLDWKGHVVEWLFDQGLEKGIEAIPGVGPAVVLIKSLASNGKSVNTGAQSASRKYDAENEMANEKKAPAIESMQLNANQGMKPFGSDLSDKNIFGEGE